MSWFFLILALIAGTFLPLQAGVNAQLRNYTGHPVIAAFISFVVGTLVLLVIAVALRIPWPSQTGISNAPWWVWTGGILGAFFVYLTIVLADTLGALVLVAVIIAGQTLASLVLDHYGLAGFSRHPVNPGRILGVLMLLSGVVLIRYR